MFLLVRAFCAKHKYYIALFYLIVNIVYTSKHYEYICLIYMPIGTYRHIYICQILLN